MQPDIREKLEAAAASSGRSLNAEIIARLEQSFKPVVIPHDIATDTLAVSLAKAVERPEFIEALQRFTEVAIEAHGKKK